MLCLCLVFSFGVADYISEMTKLHQSGNFKEALKLHKKHCDAGNVLACHILGEMYTDGKGIKQNAAKGIVFYKKACEAGSALSCHALGFIYFDGIKAEKSLINAKFYFKKACDYNYENGCKAYALFN